MDVSDKFTGWSFDVSLSNFSLICLFSQNLAQLSSGNIFYKLRSGDSLVFRVIWSFENNIFELDFSISKKTCFCYQTLSRTWFFARLWNFFLRFLVPSKYQNSSKSIRQCFRKSPIRVNNFNRLQCLFYWGFGCKLITPNVICHDSVKQNTKQRTESKEWRMYFLYLLRQLQVTLEFRILVL